MVSNKICKIGLQLALTDMDEDLFLQRQGLTNFLVALLVTCLLMGLVELSQGLLSRPEAAYLTILIFLICLESALTTRWLADPARRLLLKWHYRLAEFVIIAFLLRLLTWAIGGWPTTNQWRGLLLNPLTLFDERYFIYLLLAFLGWLRVIGLITIFDGLLLSNDEIGFYQLPISQQMAENRPRDLDRPLLFATLVKGWLIGGFFLALTTALTTVGLANFSLRTVGQLGLSPPLLLALLLYFGLGLWLISQARLATMSIRWLASRVQPRPGVVRGWQKSSFGLLLLVAILAAFLPIGSTFGLAQIMGAILAFLVGLINFLFILFTLLLALILALLGFQATPGETVPSPPPLPSVTPVGELPLPPLIPESSGLLAGTFFWGVVLLGLLMATIFYLRGRGGGLATLAQRIGNFWRWLGRVLWGGSGRATHLVTALWQWVRLRPGQQKRNPWGFIRLNGLSPRQQIYYFYLSIIRRAADKGDGRQPHQTPAEYSGRLKQRWPQASADLEEMTNAFHKARYSPHFIAPETIAPLRQIWRRIRQTIRNDHSN